MATVVIIKIAFLCKYWGRWKIFNKGITISGLQYPCDVEVKDLIDPNKLESSFDFGHIMHLSFLKAVFH